LRGLSHLVLQAQEEERNRISRDLHDQVVQTLVGIIVHLAALTQQAALSPQGLKQRIARTQRLVEASVAAVHQFARQLRPTLLDDLGLLPALQAFTKDFSRRTGIRSQFTAFSSSKIAEMDSATSTVLYRVAQEALTNVAKHAHASHVRIALQETQGVVQILIRDDGVGFDLERVLASKSKRTRLGLLGMRERVQMVGGEYRFKSSPGKGTVIRARVPLGKPLGKPAA
jgi:signal transduction histidine kinase